jgi:diamine N-acetyltransferase
MLGIPLILSWYECTQLSVAEEQKIVFPVPVVFWMAESKYNSDLKELAVYYQDEIVGFCVYGIDPDDGNPWIIALMIDKKYQGKGFGRETVKELINLIWKNCDCNKIIIGHRPNNVIAEKLYESLGFERTGQIIDGELFDV